jgi:hypothetical protein
MYNPELKNRFLSSQTTRITTYIQMFEATAKFEENLQADICTLSAKELEPILENIIGVRDSSKSLRLANLRTYVKWCVANGVDGVCEDILHIKTVGSSKISKTMAANPLHFQRYLNALFDAEDMMTIDLVYRCYLWLAYIGMNEDEIMNTKSSDVDIENMVVYLADNHCEIKEGLPIYREALQTIKLCATLNKFIYITSQYTTQRARVEGDLLLRGWKTMPSAQTIRSVISHRINNAIKNKTTELSISCYRAYLSGVFYRVYEQECLNTIFNLEEVFREIAYKDIIKKEPITASQAQTECNIRRRVNGYITDYNRWKDVYHKDFI